ncbi:MAG: hypothetical protein EOO43_02180 [Flavobacterium sp.]|nr:MAG: hypothetical protein EOO43_02180 [Flavobacterium sp.]
MIKNLPNADEYRNSAIECLTQAYNSVEHVDNQITNVTSREDLWKYHQIVLRTSLVLIHQGIEGLMKSEICQVSPLLLLDKKRSDWKTLPESKDELFEDLYTIGGEELLRTFYACIDSKRVNRNFLDVYEEVRINRNKIVHGIGRNPIEPDSILKLILNTFTYLLGKDSMWSAISSKFYNHPGFMTEDEDIEWQESILYNRLEYLNFYLGIKELNKHFSLDLTSRAYLCPFCTESAEQITNEGIKRPDSKWAFLNPNNPKSRSMSCVVCQTDFGVVRKSCKNNDCKGNVKFLLEDEDLGENKIWICLTCWHY